MGVVSHSGLRNFILAKFWVPILCIGITVGVFGRDFPTWRFILALPFLAVALFGASLAVLERRGHDLYYRRLFNWTEIPRNQIMGARVEWPSIIGSIRTRAFKFPWGKLYFVLDGDMKSDLVRRDDDLLHYLKGEKDQREDNSMKLNSSENRPSWLKLIVVGLLGALTPLILQQASLHAVPPRSVLERPLVPNQPPWYFATIRLVELLNSPAAVVALFVIFVLLAVYTHRGRNVWIYAFLAGMAVSYFFR